MAAEEKIASLACWAGRVDPVPLDGGITNKNFTVEDHGKKYVVRIGDDIPVHGVMRFNELSASRAAHAIGVSPEVVYAEPGVLVLSFIEGKTLTPEDVRASGMADRIVPLMARIHHDLPRELDGPCLTFWVFQVLRSYARTLVDGNSRMVPRLADLMAVADELEAAVGPVTLVFGHNDFLAANLIDDGNRLWVIDWDYAGFNSPLFDLGNLASNNGFSPDQEDALLSAYFKCTPDANLRRSYAAMTCASLLRESMWSMVSELHSDVDFDYVAYTNENLDRFEAVYQTYKNNFG